MIAKALMLVVIFLEIHEILMGDGDKDGHDKTGGLEIPLPVFNCIVLPVFNCIVPSWSLKVRFLFFHAWCFT